MQEIITEERCSIVWNKLEVMKMLCFFIDSLYTQRRHACTSFLRYHYTLAQHIIPFISANFFLEYARECAISAKLTHITNLECCRHTTLTIITALASLQSLLLLHSCMHASECTCSILIDTWYQWPAYD